jgi:VanZ family protein
VKRILSRSFFRYQLPLYFYIGGIFALSSIPSDSISNINVPLLADKAAHFVEYGILGFLLFRAIFSSSRMSAKWSAMLVIFCAAALGAIDESYQSLTGRDSSVYDWGFDCLGAVASLCFSALYAKIQKRKGMKKAWNFYR